MFHRLVSDQQPKALSYVGLLLCLVFASSSLYLHNWDRLTEPLVILLGLWCLYRYGKDAPLKIPMLLLLVSILIPLLSWSLAYYAQPDWVPNTPQLEKMARLFAFIPLAWFLKDSPKRVFLFWSVAAVMILLMPWLAGGGWSELQAGLEGKRIGQMWGVKNAQHVSLFFGVVLIGLLVFAKRTVQLGILAAVFWSGALLLCIYVFVVSQTRAAWLSLLVTLIVLGAIAVYRLARNRVKISFKAVVAGAAVVLVLGLILKTTVLPVVADRVSKNSDNQVVLQILKGDFDSIPYNSWGIRAHTWRAGVNHIIERPLTGWGGKGQDIAIERTEWLPDWVQERFGHMHNIYIALLLQYGLIGFAFYWIWVGWMLKTVLRANSRGDLARDVSDFCIAALVFWSVISIAESYLFFWTGVFYIQTIFAGLLALVWNIELKSRSLTT